MSEDGFSEVSEEGIIMEIFVETLTGTSFEMKVESTDTVFSIKNKIQRVEGIPVAHQNLIYKMKELEDCKKLCDVGIVNGSTLKLILTMRGGPISTRRLSVCDHHFVWKDLKELVENSRDEMGEKVNSRISLLVFKEGDVINLLRVVENEDGTFVPYSEESTSSACKSKLKEESQSSVFEKLVEDHEMLTKMSQLRQRMDDLSLKRQSRQNTKSNGSGGDKKQKMPQFKLLTESDVKAVTDFTKDDDDDDDDAEDEEIALKEKHRSKFISMSPQKTKSHHIAAGRFHQDKSTENVSSSTSSLLDPITVWPDNEPDDLFGVACNNKLALSAKSHVKLTRLVLSESADQAKSGEGIKLEENIQQDIWEINEPSAEQVKKSTCKISLLKRHQSVDCGLEDDSIDGQEADFEIFGKNVFHVPNLMPTSAIPPQYAPKEERMTCQYFIGGGTASNRRRRSPLYGRKTRLLSDTEDKSCVTRLPKINTKDLESDRPLEDFGRINFWKKNEPDELNPIKLRIVEDSNELTDLLRCDVSEKKSNLDHLPAVNKKRLRCEQCNKRLNITTMYNCRCGKLFCAQHRYSEVHNCKYDYKTEGRKLLEQQNPLVVANKLPKF